MKAFIPALLMAIPFVVHAADKSPDEGFYKKAAEGGISEVELGKLAQDKGKNPAVKSFGAHMVTDHTSANDQLKSIADGKGISLPTTSSVSQMATKAKLEVLTGDTFDKSYIAGMVQDHKEDIKEFEDEARNGQDPDAKAFAAKTLPTLRSHLAKIEKIATNMGVKTN